MDPILIIYIYKTNTLKRLIVHIVQYSPPSMYQVFKVICTNADWQRFAPTKHRGSILASVFFMQPVGRLLSNLGAVVAISSLKARTERYSRDKCMNDSVQAWDQIWHWVMGFGAISPLLGLIFRLYIMGSIRDMFDIANDLIRGTQTTNAYSISAMKKGAQPDNEPTTRNQVQGKHSQDLYPPQREDYLQLSEQERKEHQVEKVILTENYTGLRQYRFEEGYIRDLIGTSSAWFLFDLCFCFLGIGNPRAVAPIFGQCQDDYNNRNVYSGLMSLICRSPVLPLVPVLVGSAPLIYVANNRWRIQLCGYLALALMFVSVCFGMLTMIENQFGAAIVLYAISRLIFDFGKRQ